MICSRCGGLVTWRGPIDNLEYTECERCGEVNGQIVDMPDQEELLPRYLCEEEGLGE